MKSRLFDGRTFLKGIATLLLRLWRFAQIVGMRVLPAFCRIFEKCSTSPYVNKSGLYRLVSANVYIDLNL